MRVPFCPLYGGSGGGILRLRLCGGRDQLLDEAPAALVLLRLEVLPLGLHLVVHLQHGAGLRPYPFTADLLPSAIPDILHPDLIKLIGRLKYRTSFGQNALTHSMEVAWVAGLLAGEMGVNVTMARRAGLLHDIGKALDHEIEGSHVQIGVDICRKYKENTQIIHAIEAHHGDVEPKTPLAFIIQAADAISAARPGARRENVESYVKRLENLEEISSSFEGVEQAFAVQAGREVRIMVKPDVISDDQVILLARSIAKKIEDTLDYPGQIKVNVIRESRAVEYAK